MINSHMRFASSADWVEMNSELQSVARQHGIESSAMLVPLSKKAVEYVKQGEYHGAEVLMELQVRILDKVGTNDEQLSDSLYFLSLIYRMRGRSELAFRTLERLTRDLISKHLHLDSGGFALSQNLLNPPVPMH